MLNSQKIIGAFILVFYLIFGQASAEEKPYDLLTRDPSAGVTSSWVSKWDKPIYVGGIIDIRNSKGMLVEGFQAIKRKSEEHINQSILELNDILGITPSLISKNSNQNKENLFIVVENRPIENMIRKHLPVINMQYYQIQDLQEFLKYDAFMEYLESHARDSKGKDCYVLTMTREDKISLSIIFARYKMLSPSISYCIEKSLLKSLGLRGNEKFLKELSAESSEVVILKKLYTEESYIQDLNKNNDH